MGIARNILAGLILVSCELVASPAFAEKRVALIIGNGAYQHAQRLPNPRNDAGDVAGALSRSGFEIISGTDLDKAGMESAAIRFAREARDADVAMFYYSGHAIQFAGVNYLAPIDVKLSDEADLRRMVRLDGIVADVEQAKKLRIVVLDACRDNPLADELKRSIGSSRALPLSRGLAKIDAPRGMIVAYSTQAGQTADDGDGRNSPYTSAFLRHIEEEEEIGTIFRQVSEDVYEATKQKQLPELSLSIIGRFYLRGRLEVSVRPNATAAPLAPVDTTRQDFEAAERVNTVLAWDAFLKMHPEGFYAALAKERRASLSMVPVVTKSGTDGAPESIRPVVEFVDRLHCKYISFDGALLEQKLTPKVISELKRYAAVGNASAQYTLAAAYSYGVSVGHNPDESERLMKLSAEQGYPRAQADLGTRYLKRKEFDKATRLLNLSADQGDTGAISILASAYAGNYPGFPSNLDQAFRLRKLNAESGCWTAVWSLARVYADGKEGAPKDPGEAVRVYKTASDKGIGEASSALGSAYRFGTFGLAKNADEALRYYRIAVTQGYVRAEKSVQELQSDKRN